MSLPATKERFNLSAWALANKSLVVFFMLMAMIAGALSYTNLSRNEDPPFTIKTMVVAAHWPGATGEDMMNLVLEPLEKKLQETPFLDRLESYTRPGESVIFVHLRDDTPPSEVPESWYQVRKKAGDIVQTLPKGVLGPFFDDEFGDTFGLIYGFEAEGFSERELRDVVEAARERILALPDVGKVNLLGVQEEQIVVEFSPARLAAYGLDAQSLAQVLAAQNAVVPSGTVRLPEDKVALRVSGAFASEESLREVQLRVNNRYVPLTDLVTISRITADPPTPQFRVNGKPSIGLAISMAAGGNLTEFGEVVQAKMNEIQGEQPWGIEITRVADQAKVVDSALHGFIKVLVEAIAIVLAVSFVSLGTRAGIVVSVSIPLVLALTFVGMEILGIGLQRISLGALIIALGLLVDDAMITVEAMVSKLELGWEKARAASFAWTSTAFPMLTGTLVMIAGFVPVGFAKSGAGEYTYSLFVVVLISLLASWVVAVLFSPLLGTWLLPAKLPAHGHSEGRLTRIIHRMLDVSLSRPKTLILASLVVLGVSVLGMSKVQQQFFPASDRPELLISLTLPQNASFEASDAAARKLESFLADDPAVDSFSTYIGSGAIRFYLPMDVLLSNDNISQTVVVAKNLHERDALRARLEAFFHTTFAEITPRVTPLEVGPPVGWPIKYRVSGPDADKVRESAMELANILSTDPDIRDVNLSSGEPQRAVRIVVNQTEARALGLSSQDVASALAAIHAGTTVTTVRDGNRLVDVILRAAHAERTDLATLERLQIPVDGTHTIPLMQIATVEWGVEEPIIWRRAQDPFITVQGDVTPGVQAATVVARIASRVEAFSQGLPPGYAIEVGGAVEEAEKGSSSVFAVIPLMFGLMVTLLMIQLRSFSRMMVAVAMAPFGLIGVVSALLLTGSPMGFVAQLGVIALGGMIIRNAVILIEEAGGNIALGLPPHEAVKTATLHRSRPILLTALAAILGMLPISHQIFWGPMAYAMIGGLFVATALTLTLLPSILLLLLKFEARRPFEDGGFSRRWLPKGAGAA
jgi:multidrug efflux pump subunit AcrB